ncbi:MAG: DUF423 domain-containing protein [Alphaproteobacteria bacterium]|jgi:uncharacterized membrane protein YgdD (TMEM256/DUF423 family)
MSEHRWLVAAAVNGALAVAAGAFAAHGLQARADPRGLELFQMGARYQMWHALALVGVSCLAGLEKRPRRALAVAGWAFLLGIVLFSGGLYLLALTGLTQFARIVPVGGAAFVAGWLALAWAGVRRR